MDLHLRIKLSHLRSLSQEAKFLFFPCKWSERQLCLSDQNTTKAPRVLNHSPGDHCFETIGCWFARPPHVYEGLGHHKMRSRTDVFRMVRFYTSACHGLLAGKSNKCFRIFTWEDVQGGSDPKDLRYHDKFEKGVAMCEAEKYHRSGLASITTLQEQGTSGYVTVRQRTETRDTGEVWTLAPSTFTRNEVSLFRFGKGLSPLHFPRNTHSGRLSSGPLSPLDGYPWGAFCEHASEVEQKEIFAVKSK